MLQMCALMRDCHLDPLREGCHARLRSKGRHDASAGPCTSGADNQSAASRALTNIHHVRGGGWGRGPGQRAGIAPAAEVLMHVSKLQSTTSLHVLCIC